MVARLTVIVPVWRGRSFDYCARLLRHAKDMPYHIAPVWNEGGRDYYDKVAEALQNVSTPYAMRADDDDFLAMSGIERSLDFLDANPDYVAASGRVAGFSVRGATAPLAGKLNRRYLYYAAQDLGQATAHDRLFHGALRLWPYYAVHRTVALRQITREIADIGFSDLLLYEAFHTMRTLTLGKVHLDDKSISYFRQYGTSSSSVDSHNWPERFLRSNFAGDVRRMRDVLQEDIAVGVLEQKMRQYLRANFSVTQRIKRQVEARWPVLVGRWRNRPRPLGFTEWWPLKYLEGANDELAKIKSAIKPVLPYSGIGGLVSDDGGNIAGDRFPTNPFDGRPSDILFKDKIEGERWGVTLTEIARQYPFPEIKNTQFVPEGLPDLQMSDKYQRRYVNEIFRIYHRNADGLTANKQHSRAGLLYYYRYLWRHQWRYAPRAPLRFLKAALMLSLGK